MKKLTIAVFTIFCFTGNYTHATTLAALTGTFPPPPVSIIRPFAEESAARRFADPMTEGTVTTCEAAFQDPGGDGDYLPNQNVTMTFAPTSPNLKIKVSFSMFSVELNYDTLYVYHGPDASSVPFDTLSGNTIPSELVSTAATGELTFRFVSDGSIVLPGWDATVSCIEPGAETPARPGSLSIAPIAGNSASISWAAPNDYGSPITGYTLERKTGTDGTYAAVFTGTTLSFQDQGLAPGSTYFYRLAATNANGASLYSDEVRYSPGQMAETRIVTCNEPFLDPGGTADYSGNQDLTMTFAPATAGDILKVTFNSFWTESNYDFLYVYDGPADTSALITTLSGSSIPTEFYSSGPGGELTFRFTSDNLINREGWNATITCVTPGTIPPSPPTLSLGSLNGSSLALHWTRPNSNGSATTSYTLQQRTGLSAEFSTIYEGADTTFTFTGLGLEDTYYFRVKANNANGASGNSNIISYTPGRMIEGSMVGCDAIFRDPGGTGNYANNQKLVMTFLPGSTGDKVKVSFNSFSIEAGYDSLFVYDGPSTSSPLVGSFSGNVLPADILSTAPAGELTFFFKSDESGTATGWNADISCVNPNSPGPPAPVTFGNLTSNSTVVNWAAPASASAITSYTLQQKEGATGNFKTIYAGPALTFNAANLVTGRTYFYRVKANSAAGSSEYSNLASTCIPFTWYADTDGDGFGDSNVPNASCTQPVGFVANSTDCDDTNPASSSNCSATPPKQQQTITFASVADVEFKEDLAVQLNASSNSGLPVVFSVSNPEGSISDNTVEINEPGSYTITAAQPGNETYDAAAPVSHTFCVNPPTPFISADLEADPPVLSVGPVADGTTSLWYLNGDTLQTEDDTMLDVLYRGKYQVQTIYGGCASAISDDYLVDLRLTTSTSGEATDSLSVFPVPTLHDVTLSMNNDYTGELEVVVYSVEGKIHLTQMLRKDAYMWSADISLKTLPEGVYFVRVSLGEREFVRRLLKE